MSKRNSREGKARRRAERAERAAGTDFAAEDLLETFPGELTAVQPLDEVLDLAEHGGTLPCGCDAHQLLHSDGWEVLDDEDE